MFQLPPETILRAFIKRYMPYKESFQTPLIDWLLFAKTPYCQLTCNDGNYEKKCLSLAVFST